MRKSIFPVSFCSERYSTEKLSTRNELGGHAEKEFIRFFERDYIKDFCRAIRKKGSQYQSIYNDVILSGYDPKYLSTLKKKINKEYESLNAIRDVAGSRLANIFGVPTVYNFLYTQRVDRCDAETTDMLSVDFMPYGWDIVDISEAVDMVPTTDWNEFNINMRRDEIFSDNPLYVWFDIFDNLVLMDADIPSEAFSEENMARLKKDFIKMYFFRKYIIDDADLETRNVAILYNEDDCNIKLAPSHDYDFCFNGLSHTMFKKLSEEDIKYCNTVYPEELAHIVSDYKKILSQYNNYFDEQSIMIGTDCPLYKYLVKELGSEYNATKICESVVNNLRRLIATYDKVILEDEDCFGLGIR